MPLSSWMLNEIRNLDFYKNIVTLFHMNQAHQTKIINSPHYAALIKFVEAINLKIEAYWSAAGLTYAKPSKVFVHSVGGKYAKLATYRDRDGKYEVESVYCFYDVATGDLYKGGWSAPVKNGKRGNVNDADVLNKFNHYGPNYLRG